MTDHERNAVPGSLSTVWTLAGVTLRRLARGKAMWVALLFAALPVAYAVVVRSGERHLRESSKDLFTVSTLLLAIVPAMFVSASIGEEIEERTSTYLWSRPIARWAVLAAKLCALTPIVIALVVGGWAAGTAIWTGAAPSLMSCVGLAAGCIATSLVVGGIATLVPRHSMALSIGYMLADLFFGGLPFSLQQLSVSYQTRTLAGMTSHPAILGPVIALALIAGAWSAIALARIRRLEP